MAPSLAGVDGLLFDIDGVLLLGEEVIPGAAETIAALRARGIPYRFMTNTTIYCRYTLLERLHARGFDLELDELYTATYVAARYLHDHSARSYFPLLLPDAQLEFSGIDVDEENPEYVVVGDMGASFTFARLNRAFRALLNGAKLVALHKKRHWRTPDGLFLDAGPFVMALEYATETKRNRGRQAQCRLLPDGARRLGVAAEPGGDDWRRHRDRRAWRQADGYAGLACQDGPFSQRRSGARHLAGPCAEQRGRSAAGQMTYLYI